jgi:hypothetical protein
LLLLNIFCIQSVETLSHFQDITSNILLLLRERDQGRDFRHYKVDPLQSTMERSWLKFPLT